jgi:type IV secretory pathway VirD2 relaxase
VIVVKHRYIPGRGPKSGGKVVSIGKALAHVKYIQHRPGEDREKGGRELFNERDGLDASDMRKEIKRLGGNRVIIHKLTLAPEINVTDKKAFTRQVMSDLSRDKGLDLEWFGTEHNNTDHHHIHVVVLGKDRNGTDVRIDMKDIDKVKEYGDRYLERHHPRELERSRRERDDKEKQRREERVQARETAKEERVRDGLELPWMHKKIVREQIEPYRE